MDAILCWQDANLPAGQYHRRQCRCVGESHNAALMVSDNGEAGAEGQRDGGLFPSLLSRFLQGLRARMNPVCESGFQQGFDAPVERLEGDFAHDHLAIDEKGRGALNLQHVDGELPDGRELVHQRLILQAILDGL